MKCMKHEGHQSISSPCLCEMLGRCTESARFPFDSMVAVPSHLVTFAERRERRSWRVEETDERGSISSFATGALEISAGASEPRSSRNIRPIFWHGLLSVLCFFEMPPKFKI